MVGGFAGSVILYAIKYSNPELNPLPGVSVILQCGCIVLRYFFLLFIDYACLPACVRTKKFGVSLDSTKLGRRVPYCFEQHVTPDYTHKERLYYNISRFFAVR